MEKHFRRLLAIIDENKHNVREGDYIEMCDYLNKIRKNYSRERRKKIFNTYIKILKITILTKILFQKK